jgi:alkyl hydroperoxide reductase subunit AhpF
LDPSFKLTANLSAVNEPRRLPDMPAPSQQQYGNDSRVDVLIIGAGPAGLFCANGLARNGVRVRIVDKKPTKVMVGQADGIQPRTIEVLQVRDGHNIAV